ncbi:unnamed protein product, partial [Linum tenue]
TLKPQIRQTKREWWLGSGRRTKQSCFVSSTNREVHRLQEKEDTSRTQSKISPSLVYYFVAATQIMDQAHVVVCLREDLCNLLKRSRETLPMATI